jgi:uncharacterized RDD family membrane protein YckC
VQCPKCGFVSFPGLNRCKKCGYHFALAETHQPEVPPLFRRGPEQTFQRPTPNPLQSEGTEKGFPLEDRSLNSGRDSGDGFVDLPEPGSTKATARAPAHAPPIDWQKELAERMQEFRRRRALISTGKEDSENNFGLDFKPAATEPDEDEFAQRANVLEFPAFDEMNLQEDAAEDSGPDLGALALERPSDEPDSMEATSDAPREFGRETLAPSAPLEIEMDASAPVSVVGAEGSASVLGVAPLGKRFFAGLFDLAVLLCAAGVFTLIFWRAGGRLPLQPLNLAVAAAIGVIFLLAYFGVFMVFAHGTPGLIWAGLEVRTFEGNPLKRSDCLWRSFGYLVSVSALLLGFIWALVDGEGLTWHDRMSRTFLTDTVDYETLPTTTSVPT